jgi:pre-mRNA-splicing factor SYF2
MALKKYNRLIKEFKPDVAGYQEKMLRSTLSADGMQIARSVEECYRDANSLEYAGVDSKPTPEAIDRLVADVERQ